MGLFKSRGYREDRKGSKLDPFKIVGLLKACANKDLCKGIRLHAYILEHNFLENNGFIASSLVSMYARCGAITKAKQVLEELPIRDVVMWTTLIAGYVQQDQGEEALKCFDSMLQEGHIPDAIAFTCALKACGNIGAVAKGTQIYDKIVSLGMLGRDIILGNALVDMFARCGAFVKAEQVLEELPVRDVFTWTALIAGYVQHRQGEEALKCFDEMQSDGHTADEVSFIYALKACGSIGASVKGEQIHDKIVSLGLLEKNITLGNMLVDMYARCGALAKANQVLEELPVQDVITWNILLAGYIQQEQNEEALKHFDSMQRKGYSPDDVTFTYALKACGSIASIAKGEQIHEKIVSLGMLEKNIVLGNTLVDMYARCGAFAKAQQAVEELPIRDVVAWNSIMAGYAQQGQGEEALKCFDSIQEEGYAPDVITFICALKACASVGALAKGKEVHDKILNLGMLDKHAVLGSTLVDMYARCDALAKAEQVLEGLPVQDVFAWNALIAGYVQRGKGEDALKCFDNIQCKGYFPDAVTFTCALKACGSIGALSKAEEIHNLIVRLDMLGKDIVLGSTLVDVYAKCAALTKALEVFKELPFGNVVTWNSLIGGYALQGWTAEAVNLFEWMQCKGVQPDSTTLSCILNAYSHSGLSGKGQMFFSAIGTKYGITPDLEHYCCMIDLFGRAGMFNKVLDMIKEIPTAVSLPVWVAVLGACRKWGEVTLGRFAFEHALHLDKNNAAIYVCMACIYSAAGMQDHADKIEAMRLANKAWEDIECR